MALGSSPADNLLNLEQERIDAALGLQKAPRRIPLHGLADFLVRTLLIGKRARQAIAVLVDHIPAFLNSP